MLRHNLVLCLQTTLQELPVVVLRPSGDAGVPWMLGTVCF